MKLKSSLTHGTLKTAMSYETLPTRNAKVGFILDKCKISYMETPIFRKEEMMIFWKAHIWVDIKKIHFSLFKNGP